MNFKIYREKIIKSITLCMMQIKSKRHGGDDETEKFLEAASVIAAGRGHNYL